MKRDAALHFLDGGGELGALIRAKDWSATALGPADAWPQSLRSAVSILLPSKAQIALFWGPDLITLYNDAYRPVFGAKHPRALGLPIRESWSELWRAGLKELFERVLQTGEAFWAKDRPFYMERHGYPEETFFDVSYDPVRDESGAVGGVFCIVSETTGRVLGERRLNVLRSLAAEAAHARSIEEACTRAAGVLSSDPADIPFALIHLFEEGGARLAGAAGLGDRDAPHDWPLERKAQVDRLDRLFDAVPAGPWPEPPQSAMVLPLADRAQDRPSGALVLGISSRIRFDESYRGFFDLVAGQLSASIANARASEEERRRAEALAEIDRAKTAFFSNVSHEFRTPLTLMLGPLEDGLGDAEQALPPRQRERLELARRSALRLQKLVNTLLDFSRIEAGRVQASYEPVDLAALTADLASSFRSAVEKAGLELSVECLPIGEPVYVDRDMWEKVVMNLLSNAFKFTFEGGISVGLRRAAGCVELTVGDSGTGIPPQELPHIFERFRRVEGARSRTHEGTGIGLALVQELVRLHGGSVRVESAPGEGSTFTVSLPLGKDHLPAERIGAPRALASTALGAQPYVDESLGWLPDASAPAPAPAPDQRRARIIWADDNADMREYVRRLLATRYYEVQACADGEAALEAARRRRPDMLLADVMMPRLDGFGLIRAVRADPALRDLPVILLSARAGEEARIEGLGAGADDYLAKPFSGRELLARVEALLKSEARFRSLEERYRRLMALLPAGVYTCAAPSGAITFYNAHAAELWGRSPTPGDTDQRFCGSLRLWRPDGSALPHDQTPMALALREGREFRNQEVVIERPDGSRITVLVNIDPIRDEQGELTGAINVFHDTSALKQAELALKEADRRKDEFIATLSHELRNPLAPLRHALDVLRLSGAGEGRSAPTLALMERQVKHLTRLVDDLLEMSRISRGALELRRERLPVSAVVDHAVETSEPSIRAARHRLTVSLTGGPMWVDGDAVRLAQILANLLDNAAKYTPDGGEITVSAQRVADTVEISVRDNGEGIAPEALPGVFEMFTRGDRTSGPGGLGIGLALARKLAQMHGGTLDARSDGPGTGAEFILRLPAAEDPPLRDAGSQARRADLPRRRVLVVDDNRDAAESLGAVLELLGADVRLAHAGPEALEAAEAYRPSVVLLDLGMPGMDGYEVARRLRARQDGSGVSLVALTGWGQDDDRRRSREAGFDHHLVKPADIGELESLLASLR